MRGGSQAALRKEGLSELLKLLILSKYGAVRQLLQDKAISIRRLAGQTLTGGAAPRQIRLRAAEGLLSGDVIQLQRRCGAGGVPSGHSARWTRRA